MTVLLIIVVALIAMVFYLYFHRRREKTTAHVPYTEALIALLDGDEELALKRFKEAVSADSDLFDAYLRLGNIYRKRGDPARAMQIHQSLTARPTLNKHEEKKLYRELAVDALEANRPNRAVSFLKEIIKIDNKDSDAYGLILRTYEDMGSYSDCIAVYEEGKFTPKDDRRRAFYYAMLAHSMFEHVNPEEREAEKEVYSLLKKSLRIAPDSITGTFYLGGYYELKQDLKRARENYLKIINEHPAYAFLVIPNFERASYELGSFNEIIPIYEKIVAHDPRNFSVAFALANLYEKKNDITAARELYNRISEQYPGHVVPRIRSLAIDTEDARVAAALADIGTTFARREYACRNCGHTRPDFVFLCEKCHSIESFSPVL